MPTLPAKLLVSVVSLAFLFAMPAEAQKARKDRQQASTKASARTVPPVQTMHGPNEVWFGNEYLGADPDPFIRRELLRDLNAHFGGTN